MDVPPELQPVSGAIYVNSTLLSMPGKPLGVPVVSATLGVPVVSANPSNEVPGVPEESVPVSGISTASCYLPSHSMAQSAGPPFSMEGTAQPLNFQSSVSHLMAASSMLPTLSHPVELATTKSLPVVASTSLPPPELLNQNMIAALSSLTRGLPVNGAGMAYHMPRSMSTPDLQASTVLPPVDRPAPSSLTTPHMETFSALEPAPRRVAALVADPVSVISSQTVAGPSMMLTHPHPHPHPPQVCSSAAPSTGPSMLLTHPHSHPPQVCSSAAPVSTGPSMLLTQIPAQVCSSAPAPAPLSTSGSGLVSPGVVPLLAHAPAGPVMHPKLVCTLKSLLDSEPLDVKPELWRGTEATTTTTPAWPPLETAVSPRDGELAASGGGGVAPLPAVAPILTETVLTENERCVGAAEPFGSQQPVYRMPRQSHLCGYMGCGKSFRSSQSLQVHRRKHGGSRASHGSLPVADAIRHTKQGGGGKAGRNKKIPCKCPDCGKTFVGLYELRRHYGRKHTNGERKFKCQRCSKSFFIEIDLRDHERACGNTVQCLGCGMKFAFKCNVVAHQRNHPGCRSVGKYQVLVDDTLGPTKSQFRLNRGVRKKQGKRKVQQEGEGESGGEPAEKTCEEGGGGGGGGGVRGAEGARMVAARAASSATASISASANMSAAGGDRQQPRGGDAMEDSGAGLGHGGEATLGQAEGDYDEVCSPPSSSQVATVFGGGGYLDFPT